MNIDYTVTALMFPAIPLLMSVYSNRFHSLSMLIRELHDEHVYENHIPHEWKKQFINLSGRITLLRWTIMFAAFGFLFNMLTVLGLYLNEVFIARLIFGSCCLSMIISILFFIRELHDEHVYENHVPHEWKKQFINLSGRITLLRWTIMFAAFGFLFNMMTVLGLYLNEIFIARLIFGSCCLSMIISILFFIREIHISTNALKLHMSDMDVDVN